MGLLAAFQRLPFLFLTLFAGAWLDRVRRRPVMIAADVARGLVLAAIPVADSGWCPSPRIRAVVVAA